MNKSTIKWLGISLLGAGFAAGAGYYWGRGDVDSGQAYRSLVQSVAPPKPLRLSSDQLYSSYAALLVGIGDYSKRNNGYPSLRNPVEDVEQVADSLVELGFNRADIQVVKNPKREDLDQALADFAARYGQDENRGLLFYYAGHAETYQTKIGAQGYLIPTDAASPTKNRSRFFQKTMSMGALKEWSLTLKAKHVLMVFDACFSGAIMDYRGNRAPAFIIDKAVQPVRQFITAGRADERVPDRSYFKTSFIQGLRQSLADLDANGYITASELGQYIAGEVSRYNPAQHPQEGVFNHPELNKGDFIFPVSEAIARLGQIMIDANVADAIVWINGLSYGVAPLRVSLPAGDYHLRLTKPGFNAYQTDFKLRSGMGLRIQGQLAMVQGQVGWRPLNSGLWLAGMFSLLLVSSAFYWHNRRYRRKLADAERKLSVSEDNLKLHKERIEQQREQMQSELGRAWREKSALDQRLNDLQDNNQDLLQKLQDRHKAMDQVQADLQGAREEKEKLVCGQAELNRRIAQLEAALVDDNCAERLKKTLSERDHLTEEIGRIEDLIEDYRQDEAEMKNQLQQIQVTLEKQLIAKKQLENEIETIQRKTDKLDNEMVEAQRRINSTEEQRKFAEQKALKAKRLAEQMEDEAKSAVSEANLLEQTAKRRQEMAEKLLKKGPLSIDEDDWVQIPSGTFMMGSNDYEQGRQDNEIRRRHVRVAEFKMMKTPVTFEMYDAFCRATDRNKRKDEGWGRGDLPVINVSHEDACAYALWLSEQTGWCCRLPSEEEWEYACRAGTTTAYNTGDSITSAQANFEGCFGRTTPVGRYSANDWGLFDMHGNVWEWTSSSFNNNDRVLRGGSWDDIPHWVRSASRYRSWPAYRSITVGFRLVQD